MIKVLEKDEEFRKKMENVNFEDVKIATFSKELNNVAKHVRDELDNLKRKEVDRIRKLLKAKVGLTEYFIICQETENLSGTQHREFLLLKYTPRCL